ncbi:DUF732 domain-containing protein [Mycobacterium syngnathidarum]
MNTATIIGTLAVAGIAVAADPLAVPAQADTLAYLVNVTVRPGYNFASSDAALEYGRGICDKVAVGHTYAALMRDVAADFGTSDQYQASYLIGQAVNELCPALIWQLRQSAAGFRPPQP